jgi:hypothetical protein
MNNKIEVTFNALLLFILLYPAKTNLFKFSKWKGDYFYTITRIPKRADNTFPKKIK